MSLASLPNSTPLILHKQAEHISLIEVVLRCGAKPLVHSGAQGRSPVKEYEGRWFNSQCMQFAHINHVVVYTCGGHLNSSEGRIKSRRAYFFVKCG